MKEEETSRDLNSLNVGETENTLTLHNREVVRRIDQTSHVKIVDIFNVEISMKTALKSSENQQ